jgi:hypothetical protein
VASLAAVRGAKPRDRDKPAKLDLNPAEDHHAKRIHSHGYEQEEEDEEEDEVI